MPARSGKGARRQPAREPSPENTAVEEGVWRPECVLLLSELSKHTRSDPFLQPVDPEEDECPDYMKVIKAPMDLGTVKKVLNARKSYANPELFARDVRLTFNNAIKYNSKGHTVRQDAEHLLAMFESSWALTASSMGESEQLGGGKAERARKTVESFNPCGKLQPDPPVRRKKKEEDKTLSRANRSARRQEVNSSREEDAEESDAGPRRRSGRASQPEGRGRRGSGGSGGDLGGSSARRRSSGSREEGRRESKSKHGGSAPETGACQTWTGPEAPFALSQT